MVHRARARVVTASAGAMSAGVGSNAGVAWMRLGAMTRLGKQFVTTTRLVNPRDVTTCIVTTRLVNPCDVTTCAATICRAKASAVRTCAVRKACDGKTRAVVTCAASHVVTTERLFRCRVLEMNRNAKSAPVATATAAAVTGVRTAPEVRRLVTRCREARLRANEATHRATPVRRVIRLASCLVIGCNRNAGGTGHKAVVRVPRTTNGLNRCCEARGNPARHKGAVDAAMRDRVGDATVAAVATGVVDRVRPRRWPITRSSPPRCSRFRRNPFAS